MRRPRHKLEVSTFPFLAVLLGAMGSLIFLLLVMDRRAKVVAMNKARQRHESRLKINVDEERRRQEEFERERQKLHDALAAQEQGLRGQLQNLLGEVAKSQQQLQAHRDAGGQLRSALDAERLKLTRERDELRVRHSGLLQSVKIEEASKSELLRATRELLELEDALAGLKRLKSQQQPTYSLIPYRGQRGENRMPIYVECTRIGLVFLPDRLMIVGADLDFPAIRSEVERRHGPLVKAKKNSPFGATQASDEPYVLFLIRPDGIESYYRGQNALRGFQIDFGYELIDADWTIDVAMQPNTSQTVQSPNVMRPTTPRLSSPQYPGANTGGQGSGTSQPEVPTGFGTNDPTAANSVGKGGPGGFGPGPFGTTGGVGSGSLVPGAPGIIPLGPSAPAGTGLQAGLPTGAATGAPHGGAPIFRPAGSLSSPQSILDGPAPGLRVPGAAPSAGGTGGNPGGASGQASSLPSAQPGSSSANTGGPPLPGTSNVAAPSGPNAEPAPTGQQLAGDSASQPSAQSNAGTPGSPQGNNVAGSGQSRGTGTTPPSENDEPAAGNALSRLAPPQIAPPSAPKTPRDRPPPLGRVIGNRDFVVTVACYEEGVLVTPGSSTFLWNGQTDVKTTDEALLRAMSQLVARRQATVRTGEPPYRPVLRFEVHEGGRRIYHHVYPLLERLRFAMVREEVQEQ